MIGQDLPHMFCVLNYSKDNKSERGRGITQEVHIDYKLSGNRNVNSLSVEDSCKQIEKEDD